MSPRSTAVSPSWIPQTDHGRLHPARPRAAAWPRRSAGAGRNDADEPSYRAIAYSRPLVRLITGSPFSHPRIVPRPPVRANYDPDITTTTWVENWIGDYRL